MLDRLLPPADLLFDGSSTHEEFISVGEGFTRVYLIQRAQLKPSDQVLDLGSGNGQKARVLASYLNSTGSYDGLEIVKDGVDWCQSAYSHLPNFRFVHASDLYSSHYTPNGTVTADKYVLPYPDSKFDLVFCASLFTHLMPNETSNYLKQIGRVLKPGGRLVMTAFLLTTETNAIVEGGDLSFPYNFSHKQNGYRIADANDPSFAVAVPEHTIRTYLAESDLRLIELTYGTWAGKPDVLCALQDCLIAVKNFTNE
jgi:ubiquinone/menaquinone biosynthesis C-methylase UbiE